MYCNPPASRHRRIFSVLLATAFALGLLLLSNRLITHFPNQAYAQTPAVNAATLVVRSLDNGIITPGDPSCGITCTLRDAIRTANSLTGTNTIVFADGLTGEIVLDSEIDILDDVIIDGPGVDLLTISITGSNFRNDRVFSIGISDTVTLRGMTISRTGDEDGGGIFNNGFLTVEDAVVTNADYNGAGGALYNSGILTVVNTLLSNNRGLQGGGIFNNGMVTIIDSRISGSDATSVAGEGTAIRNEGGIISMKGATIDGNLRSETVANFDGGRITIVQSTFENNLRSGLSNEGSESLVEIRASDFISNGGPSIVNGGYLGGPVGGVVTVMTSTFEGPAFLNQNGGSVTLLDSLLTRRKAGSGGTAIINSRATFTMYTSTVTDNFLIGQITRAPALSTKTAARF